MNLTKIRATLKKNPVGWSSMLLSIIALAIVMFRFGNLGSVQTTLSEVTLDGDRLKANVAFGASLGEHLDRLTSMNEVISGRLVRSNELAINLQYFYKLESETGVKLLDLRQLDASPLKGSRGNNYSVVPYSVRLQGRFQNILLFIKRLEEGTYYTRILTANVGSPRRSDNEAVNKDVGNVVLNLGIEVLGKSI
jgi:hypothetical protein